MKTDGAQLVPSHWEKIVDDLISRVRRSRWAAGIRIDAEHLRAEGYRPDVALMKAAKYWLEGEQR